jgi:hypothetical protein
LLSDELLSLLRPAFERWKGADVTRSDLRALFRSNDRELRAVDVFADRHDEWTSVCRSLERHVQSVREPGFDVADLESPRRNVLVF